MKKTDPTVRKETIYIAVWTVLLSLLIHSVFLILRKWDYTVLTGNIAGIILAVMNFFLLGRTVQNALSKEGDDAKNAMKVSQLLRYLMIIVGIAAVAVLKQYFNTVAAIVPLIFPRIAIAFRPLFNKKEEGKGE